LIIQSVGETPMKSETYARSRVRVQRPRVRNGRPTAKRVTFRLDPRDRSSITIIVIEVVLVSAIHTVEAS